MSIRLRQAVPLVGLDKVLDDSSPLCIHPPKFRKSQSMSLLCRPTQPAPGHLGASRSPLSLEIQRAEVDLGSYVPLLRGFFKPLLRLPIVLGYTRAFVVQLAESELSGCVSFFG